MSPAVSPRTAGLDEQRQDAHEPDRAEAGYPFEAEAVPNALMTVLTRPDDILDVSTWHWFRLATSSGRPLSALSGDGPYRLSARSRNVAAEVTLRDTLDDQRRRGEKRASRSRAAASTQNERPLTGVAAARPPPGDSESGAAYRAASRVAAAWLGKARAADLNVGAEG
jgi:hypothetical protein